ncbi:MAG: hypothetical protein WC333_00800 [Dehalococcoidia bacterium]|jgi:hypothetical protein
MKLLAYTINGQKLGVDIKAWNNIMLSGNTAFIAIGDGDGIPADYTDISSVNNWDSFAGSVLSVEAIKTEILKLIPNIPTPEQFKILEGYATVGLNSMTNIDGNLILSSISTPNALTGVTDSKMATTGGTTTDLTVENISGSSGTFWGDLRIEGKLWIETIRRVKQEANQMQIRVNQDSGLGGGNIAGLVILNPTGATTGTTVPYYIVGVNKDGVLVAGWGDNTQPIAVGGAIITTYHTGVTGNITTTSTTAVLMTGMQFTNVPAGTYLVSFGTSLSHGTSSVATTTSIYVGGNLVSNSELTFMRGTQAVTANHGYSNFRITLATAQNVEIRWRTASGTATANTNRYMTLLKVL